MNTFPFHSTATVLLWSICTSILVISVTCNKKIHCNPQDMTTLLNFKKGVTDPFGILSSWFADHKDCRQWIGVRCDDTTGRVTELNLPCHTTSPAYADKDDKSHCLTGELNLSLLLDLEFLDYLNLSNNDFKTILYDYSMHNRTCNEFSRVTPLNHCGNSSNLQYLDLSNNYDLVIYNLNWFTRVSSLQYLDLSGIDLHRKIDWLRSVTVLPSLVELHLESCQLQDIYPSLQYANFTSLKVLDLVDNNFASELPYWLFNLSCDVSKIILAQNRIHGQLPKVLLNRRTFKSLDLGDNFLDGSIPEWFGQLEHLQELDLSGNSFSGPIPTSLGNLSSSMTFLNLETNHLSGNLPESLRKLFNLEVFGVGDNFLTGNISERNFESFVNLNYLSLSSPGLIFDFDHEWVPPFQIQSISLGYVVPKLPSWLYTQSSLKSLTITDSRVSFEPLDKFWKFVAELEFLSLTNNSINADMSNVLLNSKTIWLNENNLRGSVPQISPNVTLLNLEHNTLSGSISPLLCQKMMKGKRKLEFLRISNNRLSGEIPNCWTDWKLLLDVQLRGNNLTGKIPNSIGSLSNLISLDLSNNKLSGVVPLSLQNCKNLWILNLAGNNFSGTIPRWKEHNAKALILRSNQFSGNIPAEICQLHSLKILDFANNRLSGSIPNCLHNMTSMISEYASLDQFFIHIYAADQTMDFVLEFMLLIKGIELPYSKSLNAIDLSSNRLSGTVPSELFMLIRLQSLNLSHNHLEGMMPQEIANLNQLESLDLSSNRFSGQIPQSMSGMSFLEVLNLSFNNFMGEIPSGTQLQSFTNLSYMGNPQLCGPPLTKSCTQGVKPHNAGPVMKDENDAEESEVHSMFYMGLGIGFAAGLWGVLGVIFFNKRCRHAYFRFVNKHYDIVLLKMDHVYWKLRNCYNGN